MFNATLTGKKNNKNSKSLNNYRLAIIDLGTNSVRLDIYRVSGKKVMLTFRDKTMIRLGDGVYKTGRLSPAGVTRCLRTFQKYGRLLNSLKVNRVVAFGTSALRSSANASLLLQAITKSTGIVVRVISGREEGRLIARGIMANEILPKECYALVDIGGGSTEISICKGERILFCHSCKLGANRLNQIYFKSYPVVGQKGELHPLLALRQHIRDELDVVHKAVRRFAPRVAIGSSGTIRTANKILKKLGHGGKSFLRMDLSGLVAEMQVMNLNEIRRVPGLEPKRVDIIVPGIILLEEILYALRIPQMRPTEYALREGILDQVLNS